MPDKPGALREHVVCVRCAAVLDVTSATPHCKRCHQPYGVVGRIPILLPRVEDHLNLWRGQLATLEAQAEKTQLAIDSELETPGLLPAGIERLRALGQALRDQVRDLTELVGPALGSTTVHHEDASLPRGIVEYIQLLYRDWGWESAGNRENERALSAIQKLCGPAPLGRLLVIGAGACRLAYDLHRQCGASETAVIDVDPFLFLIAEAVIRGQSVRLTEATANVQELSQVAKQWQLRAPAGGLDANVFHFFLANGLAPPFADGTFDSVVTPWFIDHVPRDLPAFLSVLRRQLRTGGRWFNSGPLIYPADTPLAKRYSREELFDLVERAGFHIEHWASETSAHLQSPLSGRATIEWSLTFEASAVGELTSTPTLRSH
ncbi:MAG: methyltransferase domain-containing protein [Polyangiaceae bacterium]